jgi:hypothetical protein
MLLRSLCRGSNCCLMRAALYVGRALEAAKILNFGVERSKNVHDERISNTYFDQILQKNSLYVPLVL